LRTLPLRPALFAAPISTASGPDGDVDCALRQTAVLDIELERTDEEFAEAFVDASQRAAHSIGLLHESSFLPGFV
jgi:hypothetical protein